MFVIKPTLFTGKCFIELPQIDSTNVYALNLLKHTNIAEGTVVSTLNQTKGKGNANNRWLSKPDKNLSFSIIYQPTFLLARQQFYLNMAICLGIVDALPTKPGFSIKWPNDIYYKNYKVGGLLFENIILGKKIKHSIIGIGVNVNQVDFSNELPNPTSLTKIFKKKFVLYELITDILLYIEKRYLQLKAMEFIALKKAYLNHLYLYEQAAIFKVNVKHVSGTIKGINENGQLLIKIGDELREFGFKEVEFMV